MSIFFFSDKKIQQLDTILGVEMTSFVFVFSDNCFIFHLVRITDGAEKSRTKNTDDASVWELI